MNYFAPSIALVGVNVLLLVRSGVFIILSIILRYLSSFFFICFFHFHY